MVKQLTLIICLLLLIAGCVCGMQIKRPNIKAQSPQIGFLVLAPDRGFVGNNETLSVFQEFKKEYLANIIFGGR